MFKDFKDWKRAVLKAPLHFAMSIPVAAASLAVPQAGEAYLRWRKRAEADDVTAKRDTPEKSTVDLWSQTALVHGVLKVWGK